MMKKLLRVCIISAVVLAAIVGIKKLPHGDTAREAQVRSGEAALERDQRYQDIFDGMAAFLKKDRDIDVIKIGVKDTAFIVAYRDPAAADLNAATESALFIVGLAAGLVRETILRETVDTVVLLPHFDNGKILFILVSTETVFRLDNREITQKQFIDALVIKPFEPGEEDAMFVDSSSGGGFLPEEV